MNRFLLIDIGAGTMDILFHERHTDSYFKAVVKSPVRCLAEKIEAISGNLVVTGKEMGGGPISQVLLQKAQKNRVLMTEAAAATIHHNLDRVRAGGIEIISPNDAAGLKQDKGFTGVNIGDIDIERIRRIVNDLGVAFDFDAVAICAQDHGVPPQDTSHLDFRHSIFSKALDNNPYPHALLYRSDEVPAYLNRLQSIAADAGNLPTDTVFVMDSGMAAILGASLDPRIGAHHKALVLDIATSHTVGAAVRAGEIAGFFEYHTHDIALSRLETLLQELADGKMSHEAILSEGGHGAYLRYALNFNDVDIILATGPKRKLVITSRLPIVWGAPLGDNMMTGTVGLLEAVRRRIGLEPLPYI